MMVRRWVDSIQPRDDMTLRISVQTVAEAEEDFAADLEEGEEGEILAVAVNRRISHLSPDLRRQRGSLLLLVRPALGWGSLRRLRQHIKAVGADGALLLPGIREVTREALLHLPITMVTMDVMATTTATKGGIVKRAYCFRWQLYA